VLRALLPTPHSLSLPLQGSTDGGGAVFVDTDAGSVTFSSCSFVKNAAVGTDKGDGGMRGEHYVVDGGGWRREGGVGEGRELDERWRGGKECMVYRITVYSVWCIVDSV
jgi:hypothetical protein